jgi:hypothetical protein
MVPYVQSIIRVISEELPLPLLVLTVSLNKCVSVRESDRAAFRTVN